MVAGSFGVAGAYSFYPTKNLGAPGDGGMLVTGNKSLADRARHLRNYGQSERYHHPEIGMNSRLDELHAAMLSERMNWLHIFTQRRQQIAEAYSAGILNKGVEQLVQPEEPAAHVYHLYVITCENRKQLQAHLHQHQVQSLIHYPVPVQYQKPCQDVKKDPMGLKVSEQHAATCLSLPCHPQMSDSDIAKVIDAVNTF